jgi:hypothetical protein
MSEIAKGANFVFGLIFSRFRPMNTDLSLPAPDNLIGGIGPFDFSAEADTTQVPLKFKQDNVSTTTVLVDVSLATGAGGTGVADEAAVTVDELVLSINAATSDLTASKDANDRIKIIWSGAGTPTDLQVWDRVIVIAEFAQGYPEGMVWLNSDTFESIGRTPVYKDSETITQTTANGIDIEVETDVYRKGVEGAGVDTAADKRLVALIEGGTLTKDGVTGKYTYETPTINDKRYAFQIELYQAQYCAGTANEGDIVGYQKVLIRNAKGTIGDAGAERDWSKTNINYKGTAYRPDCNTLQGDSVEIEMTIEQYEALDLPGRNYVEAA